MLMHLPLDTQSQYNTIMTLKGFLTFIGGAGVPHLRREGEKQIKYFCFCFMSLK